MTDPDELPPPLRAEMKAMEQQTQSGAETLGTRYSEGDVVNTPQGRGVVVGVWTNSWESDGETVEASENSPTYTVALKDKRVGYEHYKASQLEEAEFDTEVENPLSDVEATADLIAATDVETMSVTDWEYPPTWEESETPARVILLDAWASLGGQFNCGGACCMGEFNDKKFCASMKDRVLMTEEWRGWGPD